MNIAYGDGTMVTSHPPEKKQMDTVRVFVKWLESVNAVDTDLHTKVRSPTLRDGENICNVMLDSDRAKEVLDREEFP